MNVRIEIIAPPGLVEFVRELAERHGIDPDLIREAEEPTEVDRVVAAASEAVQRGGQDARSRVDPRPPAAETPPTSAPPAGKRKAAEAELEEQTLEALRELEGEARPQALADKLGITVEALRQRVKRYDSIEIVPINPQNHRLGVTYQLAAGDEEPLEEPDDDELYVASASDEARTAGGAIDLEALDEAHDRPIVEALMAGRQPQTTGGLAIRTGIAAAIVGARCVQLRNRGLVRGIRPADSTNPPRWALAIR